MPCENAQFTTRDYSVCSLRLYGGNPSHRACVRCQLNTDRMWHEKIIIENLTASANRKRSKPVFIKAVSEIGTKLHAILAGYGITEAAGCSCKAMANRLNGMTKDQVLEKIEQLALGLVDNLKRNPNVADNAPVWVRMAVKAMRFDPTDVAAKAMAEKLLRQACG